MPSGRDAAPAVGSHTAPQLPVAAFPVHVGRGAAGSPSDRRESRRAEGRRWQVRALT